MADQSQFKMISISYVAENKLRTTNEVEISLVEALPFVNGELSSDLTQESVDSVNSRGDAQTFSVYTANTIRAQWLGDGTNRVSAPDVRRGEKVKVLQFGDTDQYFWQVFNEPGVNNRKRETVVTAYSNTTDEKDNTPSEENSWIHEVNTHEKTVTFKTNKADGEPFAYTTQINAKEGNVVVADDIGNYIQMNSKDQLIEVETASGARLELNQEDIEMLCNNFKLDARGKITLKGGTGEIDIPTSNWKGNVEMKGNLSLTGNMVGNAGGNYTFNGKLINNGKNVGDTHTHIGVQGGNGTSGQVS